MKLNQKLISHYFLSTSSLYSASFHFHCFFFSLHVWALQGTAKYHFWKWLTLITIFWIEIVFPSIPNIPNTICVHNVQFGNDDDQEHNHSHSPISSLWIHTASCSPHQCLPGGSWPERKSTVWAAQFQEPIHQEDICDSGVWGRCGTKVMFVYLCH